MRNTVNEVMMVRLKVSLTAMFITLAGGSLRSVLDRSRIRSKMTIVSLIENPAIVRSAATTVRVISLFVMLSAPTVMKTSWKSATTAPSE